MLNTRCCTSEKGRFPVPRATAAAIGDSFWISWVPGALSSTPLWSAVWPFWLLRVLILQSSPTQNEENSEAYRLPRGDDSELQALDVKLDTRFQPGPFCSTARRYQDCVVAS